MTDDNNKKLTFIEFCKRYLTEFKTTPQYEQLMAMPPAKRWATIAGSFALSQVIVFGGLYLIFDEIVVIGFFASILAGLATGLGALPAVFF